jgi:hypothetical protein
VYGLAGAGSGADAVCNVAAKVQRVSRRACAPDGHSNQNRKRRPVISLGDPSAFLTSLAPVAGERRSLVRDTQADLHRKDHGYRLLTHIFGGLIKVYPAPRFHP